MNSRNIVVTPEAQKLAKLRKIFDIVDRKYTVERDLRPTALVRGWVRDEVHEVMEEVRKGDDVARRDETGDLIYVTYAYKKWSTGLDIDAIIEIFRSQPSIWKYVEGLSIQDLDHSYEKFRGRNEYLFDEDFLAELAKHESKTRRMDMIDDAWDLIKYKKQKGFNTDEYKELLRKYSLFLINPESSDYYDVSAKNLCTVDYLRQRLVGFGVTEPYLTYIVNCFSGGLSDLSRYVDACEIYIAKGLTPELALVGAAFKCQRKFPSVYWKGQVTYLLDQVFKWPWECIGTVYSQLRFESYLFAQYMINEGMPHFEAINLMMEYASPLYCPIPDEFHRKLRPIVERGDDKYKKLRSQGKTPDSILQSIADEAIKLAAA